MTTPVEDEGYSPRPDIQRGTNNKSRILGVSLLITEIGSMVAYGITGQYFSQNGSEQIAYQKIFSVMMLMLFTLVGFGLLLSAYKFGTWLGTSSAIIVVAISIQYAPLLQKLWFSILITGFGTSPNASQVGSNIRLFWTHYQTNNIDVSYQTSQTTLLCCISILTALTAYIGRVNINQVLKMTTFFIILWNMNYFILIRMCVIIQDFNGDATPQFAPYFFDAFGSSFVYLFGSVFGIVYSFFLRQRLATINPYNQFNRTSLVLALIGTAFIYATFIFATNNFITYGGAGNTNSRFAIIFALTGSVIGSYIGSALAGKGRVGYKECLTGVISGGVVIASVAPILANIGIIIMIGVVTGFLSGIYMRTIHVALNKTYVHDALGLFGPFFIASFLGSFVVVPSVLAYYKNNNIVFPTIGVLVPDNLPGWQLVYVGITVGVAAAAAILCGLFSLCDRDNYGVGSNSRYFLDRFGLYDTIEEEEVVYAERGNESSKYINEENRRVSDNEKVVYNERAYNDNRNNAL